MGPGAVVALIVTLISVALWGADMHQPGHSPDAAFAGLAASAMAGVTVGLILRRRHQRDQLSGRTYNVSLVVTLVLAVIVGVAAYITPSIAAGSNAGEVIMNIDGPLSGTSIGDTWGLEGHATVTTSTYPDTVVTFATTPSSAFNAWEVTVVLADGSAVHCGTTRPVDWGTADNGGKLVQANCPVIPYPELKRLQSIHIG